MCVGIGEFYGYRVLLKRMSCSFTDLRQLQRLIRPLAVARNPTQIYTGQIRLEHQSSNTNTRYGEQINAYCLVKEISNEELVLLGIYDVT